MSAANHIVSVSQFDNVWLERLFTRSRQMRGIAKRGHCSILCDKLMASLFYEPSTRTRFSFEVAMARLGGSVIGTENASKFSSATKGESSEDSVRVIGGYADVIILRHSIKGEAARAAAVSPVPLINAGDGDGEHPTQALLDLFTIIDELGTLDRAHVVFVGDLKMGRTVHSLARLLALYKTKMTFVSPETLTLPDSISEELRSAGCQITHARRLESVIAATNVVYMTRTQNERHENSNGIKGDGSDYALTRELVDTMSEHAIVMHPLPRNSEIPAWFDDDPRAAYFRQAQNGLFVRMALLEELLNPFPG